VSAAGWGAAFGAAAVAAAARREVALQALLVARACHEVRGPLTAAALGLHGARPEIASEIARAGRALDDLQDAGHGRPPALGAGWVDVVALAHEAVLAVRAFAARHGAEVSLTADTPGAAWVRGDQGRLAQACLNLLRNAAEHGGGRVLLSIRRRAGRVLIAVEDGGPGLPAALHRLTGARRGGPRRGHGLAIASEIAIRHGGRLSAVPSARGARLVLELPAAAR
jgi:signal transduction histidine kinase